MHCEEYRTSRMVALKTPKIVTIFMTMIIITIMKLTTVMVKRRGYDEKEKRKMDITTTVMMI
jgi:hypothetical protein